jgi:hypothetical protein
MGFCFRFLNCMAVTRESSDREWHVLLHAGDLVNQFLID